MADNNERIDDLLKQVNDPVLRAVVVVLNSINRDLIVQTTVTQQLVDGVKLSNDGVVALTKDLASHVSKEDNMVAGFRAQVKLAAWIGPVLFAVLGSIGGYLWITQVDRVTKLEALYIVVKETQIAVLERVKALETK